MSTTNFPFHYAFKVTDLQRTREFYIDLLGCAEGRSTHQWVDFDFFGHQLSAHLVSVLPAPDYCGEVDGIKVPMPHFGCVLSLDVFEAIAGRLEAAGVDFVIPPQTCYEGQPGEQRTMFALDPSSNALEFKAMSRAGELFE